MKIHMIYALLAAAFVGVALLFVWLDRPRRHRRKSKQDQSAWLSLTRRRK